jgi:hypothetical protein
VSETGWRLIQKTRVEARGSLTIGVLSLIAALGTVLLFGWRVIDALPGP